MTTLKFTKKFEKQLKTLNQSIRERILKSIEELEKNPLKGKTLKGTYEAEIDSLRVHIHLRSLRIGDYRVIYWFDALRNVVWLLSIGHRKKIYREL